MTDFEKVAYLKGYVESSIKRLGKDTRKYSDDLIKGRKSNVDIDKVDIELDVYHDIMKKLAAD